MSQTIFTDGILDIVIVNGVVRIEFFTLTPNRDNPANSPDPTNMSRTRVLTVGMPLAGFAGSLKFMDDLKQKLIADGVLRDTPEQPAAPNRPGGKSPNFN
jgi:hypothetical protein